MWLAGAAIISLLVAGVLLLVQLLWMAAGASGPEAPRKHRRQLGE